MDSAAPSWSDRSLRDRLALIRRFRQAVADHPQLLIDAIQMPFRRLAMETISAEIIPLADACRFLEKNAWQILRSKRLGWRGRPTWLWGVRSEIHRVPLGTVLIIGPANYPLMLPGIQIVQALAAGNRVVFKPAPATGAIAAVLQQFLIDVGVPRAAITVTDESSESLETWWTSVDKVIVTGSYATGLAVMAKAAAHGLPTTMELSGCDAAIVLPGAVLSRVAACMRFAMEFNGSFSCIAPRRLFVHESTADAVCSSLLQSLEQVQPVRLNDATRQQVASIIGCATRSGARIIHGSLDGLDCTPILIDGATVSMQFLQQDVSAPLLSIHRMSSVEAMIQAVADCRLRLGASVFGPIDQARQVAKRLPVGSIVVNDVIVPTADPRLPFGGTGRSGFGATRGSEGLLEMTRAQVISIRHGNALFHLRKQTAATESFLRAQLFFQHGSSVKRRVRGILQAIRAARRA